MTSSYAAVAVHGSPWCRSRDALHSGQRATSRHGSGEWAEPEEPWPSSPADSTSVPQIGQAFGRSESPTLHAVGNFQLLTFPSSSGIRLLRPVPRRMRLMAITLRPPPDASGCDSGRERLVADPSQSRRQVLRVV